MKKSVVEAQNLPRRTDTGVLEHPRFRTGSEVSAGASRQPGTGKLHILHVEDNPADAILVEEYLRDLVPDIAFDSAARLSEVTTERVVKADCALLDLSLPDASGLDALLALRVMDEELPIIVLTGFDDMELGLTAVRLGADDYLLKNHVDAYTLERSVLYAVERRGLMVQVARATAEALAATAASLTVQTAASQAPVQTGHEPREFTGGDSRLTTTPTPGRAVKGVHSLQADELLTTLEVAALMYVDPRTVTRWAEAGKIESVRTPGGHRRFFKDEILAMSHKTHRGETQKSLPATAPPSDANTPRDTEADAVVRAVRATAEVLIRAAREAAAAARKAR